MAGGKPFEKSKHTHTHTQTLKTVEMSKERKRGGRGAHEGEETTSPECRRRFELAGVGHRSYSDVAQRERKGEGEEEKKERRKRGERGRRKKERGRRTEEIGRSIFTGGGRRERGEREMAWREEKQGEGGGRVRGVAEAWGGRA